MEFDKFAVLKEEIQKGIADLAAGRVRSGMQVLEDLLLRCTAQQDLEGIQEGKTLSLDGVKNISILIK